MYEYFVLLMVWIQSLLQSQTQASQVHNKQWQEVHHREPETRKEQKSYTQQKEMSEDRKSG